MGSCGPVLHSQNERIEWVQAHCVRHVLDRHFRFTEVNFYPTTEVPCCCQIRFKRQSPIDQGGASVKVAEESGEREPTSVQCDCVVLSQTSRLPGKALNFGDCLRIVLHPAIVLAQDVAPRGHSISRSIIGIEFNSPVEQSQRLADGVLSSLKYRVSGRYPQQIIVVGIEAFGRLAFGSLDLGFFNRWRDRPYNARRHLILEIKDVVQPTVNPVCPNMCSGCRIDELSCDTHAVCGLANAPLQDVTDPKIASNLLHVDCAALVCEAGVAGYDKQRLEAG